MDFIGMYDYDFKIIKNTIKMVQVNREKFLKKEEKVS